MPKNKETRDSWIKEEKMKLWIEDEDGRRIECNEIKEIRDPDSILVFETDWKLTKPLIDDFQAYVRDRTGHECILADGGVTLVAAVSLGNYVKR